jgi:hypothetical protein
MNTSPSAITRFRIAAACAEAQDSVTGTEERPMSADDTDPKDPSARQRVGRRLLVLRLATPAAAAALVVAAPAPAEAQRYTGITDRDPSDPPGGGRGFRTGITDSDPSDPPGGGRGRARTGLTDSDPSDPAGDGRRGR